jgi:hypothetical protein
MPLFGQLSRRDVKDKGIRCLSTFGWLGLRPRCDERIALCNLEFSDGLFQKELRLIFAGWILFTRMSNVKTAERDGFRR